MLARVLALLVAAMVRSWDMDGEGRGTLVLGGAVALAATGAGGQVLGVHETVPTPV
jgi:hypothetical protein